MPNVAVMTAQVEGETGPVETAKVADVLPSGISTLAGTVTAGLSLASVTTWFSPASRSSVTVPVAVALPTKELGDRVSRSGASGPNGA